MILASVRHGAGVTTAHIRSALRKLLPRPIPPPARDIIQAKAATIERLPAEITANILTMLRPYEVEDICTVSRRIRAIAKDTPALYFQQIALADATRGKSGEPLLVALEEHKAALRHAECPFVLPLDADASFLERVAQLVKGSKQRPLACFTSESLLPTTLDIDIEFAVLDEISAKVLKQAFALRDEPLRTGWTFTGLSLDTVPPRAKRFNGSFGFFMEGPGLSTTLCSAKKPPRAGTPA